MSGWTGCLDGQDVFATIKENSLSGEVVAELASDTTMEGVHWSLDGKDADWFFLDERSIRLNTSADKILDRESLSPVLMAELSCFEEDIFQSVYRIMVEILNENDNSPVFAEYTAQSLTISELTPVNSVVFTVQATDTDNDKIIYSIDQASPDAEYFKIDLPNSGEVILAKPLDYETKILLTVTIYASEMNTAEHFNTSTNITITVLDGDDQYPQFVPCILLLQDETNKVCTSPMYIVNVTEGEEDIVLDFYPGPIHAVDGDRGLSSPLSYVILSGDDDGRFQMDRETGEVRLTQGVRDRLTTPALHLKVMAYQDNDPRKYSVATVLVQVLAVNYFHPEFEMAEYHGFVTAAKSAASLVNTYGRKALILHVQDQDFDQGFNPMVFFSFSLTSNHTNIYQVTQEGLLIAKTSQLRPKQKHVLEVMAVDQESGDATFATVVVEVLSEGQAVPHSPLGDDRLTGCTVGKALFLSMVFMSALGCILSMLMWLKKRYKGTRDPLERGCVAQGKHPNVVSHRSAMPHMDDRPYHKEEYGTCNPSFSFPDKPGTYTFQELSPCQGPVPPRTTDAPDTSFIPNETCSVPRSHTRIASAEIEKPIHKACAKTPECSALQSSPVPEQTSTPPPTREHVPLKDTLIYIDRSAPDTPPETPEQISASTEDNQPSTSLDQTDPSGHEGGTADIDSLSQYRRPSTNSGNTQDGRGVGQDDDDLPGDEDADKNSEDDLDPEDEELLRVLARCNPIFITFSK
ncbi:cadherin-related family member 5 [Brachyistius frenatus]|uniref:cadherin-related family member 5 n=1 Tax=Brachyistius frenatus TaxID=100188 RepID=UPI0037E876EC